MSKLGDIKTRIATAAKQSGRNVNDITLIAVSKNRTPEQISALIAEGQMVFGENRVQEAQEKFPPLKEKHQNLQLHFIGHLQSNKAKEAIALFDMIHSIDRPSVAEAAAKEMHRQNRNLPCFIQVNTGEEAQKGGISPRETEQLLITCRETLGMNIIGLMCIPPEKDIPDLHFALLHKMARDFNLPHLSMGMSADVESAIRFGATYVRIGSALF